MSEQTKRRQWTPEQSAEIHKIGAEFAEGALFAKALFEAKSMEEFHGIRRDQLQDIVSNGNPELVCGILVNIIARHEAYRITQMSLAK